MAAQQRAAVAGAAAGSWLGLRLQLMSAALAAAVAVAAVAEHAGSLPWALAAAVGGAGRAGGGSAGLVGLSLTYVLPITGLLSGLLSASAETGERRGWQLGGPLGCLQCGGCRAACPLSEAPLALCLLAPKHAPHLPTLHVPTLPECRAGDGGC